MHWIQAAAIELNGGVHKRALPALCERLGGMHIDTVRRWVRGERPIPPDTEVAVRALLEVGRLSVTLNKVLEAVHGYQVSGGKVSGGPVA